MNTFDVDDEYINTIYSFDAMEHSIPKNSMPEKGLPERIVYQLIHDEISLDGRPSQNLASFVTTWMEDSRQ